MILRITALLIIMSQSAWAAEFVVVQSSAPTSNGGTQDFAGGSGFGTPKCSMFWGGYGITNGTQVDNSGFRIGFYDGTRQYSNAFAAEDGQATTDTGSATDTNSAAITLLATTQAKDGDGTASNITDGARLTWADAPPSAYLMNGLLIGGSGITSCYVGTATGNASQNGTTAISAPGFKPDIIIAFAYHNNTAAMRPSIGFLWNNGGSIVQRGLGYNNSDAAATVSISSILRTDLLIAPGIASSAGLEVTSLDTNGFTVTTRDAGGARDFYYMAIKLNTYTAWLGTKDSPTSTGTNSITGAGIRPQVALMLQGEFAAVDTLYQSSDGENFGLSACTSTACASSAVWGDDGAADSNEESITDNKWSRVRKASADFSTCTLTSFDADGLTENCTVTPGSAKQRAILLIQGPDIATTFIPGARRFR